MLLRCVRPMRAASRRSSLFWRSFSSASANSLEACVRERQLPPFERLQLAEIEPAVTNAVADYTRDLHELERQLRDAGKNVQFVDVVDPLEVQGDALGRMWGIVGHLMSVRNSEELRAVHDKLQQLVIETVTEASQSKTLYDAYQAVRESDDWSKLELAQQRIIELSLRSATLSGVGLEGEEKDKFNKLKLRAAELVSGWRLQQLQSPLEADFGCVLG
jgi:oligopeptidase A